jgi:2-dehydro-3-deoxygluconokinase
VAVSLAHFGLDSWFLTRLPANPVGDAAARALRAEGVRTDLIVRGGARLGLYFAETGASQRAPEVVYDRAGSAVAEMEPGTVDWDQAMAGASWFHVTGITPALGPAAAACAREAIGAAKRAGARVSIDLNFRRKLWTEVEACAALRPLLACADAIVANEEQVATVLGIEAPAGCENSRRLRVVSERVASESGASWVAITRRDSRSASDNGWGAALWDRVSGALHESEHHEVHLVDRIGGGDAFTAGLIYALVTGRPAGDAVRFAAAAGALKQTIPGDFNRVSVAEVDRLAGGDATGRVRR